MKKKLPIGVQIQLHKFQSTEEQQFEQINTIEIEEEIWFVGKQVCNALDIKNASDAISRLDDDEKLTSVLPISGQNRSVNLINESGK